jgi:integrase
MAGDGTLYQDPRTKIWYWIVSEGWDPALRGGKGGYKQKWNNLETTDKNEAKEKRKQIQAQITTKGHFIQPSRERFSDWLDFWLNEIAKPKVSPTTYDFYEYIIRIHIKPKLGSAQLKQLEPEMIQRFFNQKRTEKKLSRKKDDKGNYIPTNEPISKRLVKGIEIVLSMSISKAVAMRKILENPLTGLDRISFQREEVKYMTTEQVADFLDKIKDDQWYYVFLTAFGSGARLSELVALKWDDIDYANKTIRVDEARVEVNTYATEGPKTKVITKDTKSKKGKRIIPVPDDVIIGLKKLKEIQIKERWEWEKKRLEEEKVAEENPYKKPKRKHKRPEYFQSGYVFTKKDGSPPWPGHLSKHFSALTREHGFEGLTFHKQRHSYASMLLEAGEDMKVIQENLGDATLQVVTDTYTHVAEKLKRQAATKLNGFTKKKVN